MKTTHVYLCDCCPFDVSDLSDTARRMLISAEWIDGKFYWDVPKPCARGHRPMSIDSDALKAAHAKALS